MKGLLIPSMKASSFFPRALYRPIRLTLFVLLNIKRKVNLYSGHFYYFVLFSPSTLISKLCSSLSPTLVSIIIAKNMKLFARKPPLDPFFLSARLNAGYKKYIIILQQKNFIRRELILLSCFLSGSFFS